MNSVSSSATEDTSMKTYIAVPEPGGYADVYDAPKTDYTPELIMLLGIIAYCIHKALSNG
jgi:hypothetical protein